MWEIRKSGGGFRQNLAIVPRKGHTIMNNVKVSFKILLLVLIALIGMAVIGFRGWSGLSKAGSDMNKMYSENLQAIALLGDEIEAMAVKAVFGKKTPLVNSTKGATGHMMGATGAVEAIASVKALEEGIIPPTINYKEKDEECDLDYKEWELGHNDLDLGYKEWGLDYQECVLEL